MRANNWILHLQIYSFLLIEMRSIFANTHPHESISKAYFWKENPPLIKCHSMTIHLSQTKISLNRFLQRWVALKNVMTIWKLCSCWPGPCSCCGRSREWERWRVGLTSRLSTRPLRFWSSGWWSWPWWWSAWSCWWGSWPCWWEILRAGLTNGSSTRLLRFWCLWTPGSG